MTITLDDVTTRNSWGYIEAGHCMECRTYQDLYVMSVLQTEPSCSPCLIKLARYALSNTDQPTDWDALQYLIDSRPQYAEGIHTCYSCGGIEADGLSTVLNATWDGENNEIYVHDNGDCATCCEHCSTTYSKYNWRVSSLLNDRTHAQFEKIFGEECCPKCKDEIYDEHGGSDAFMYCDMCESMELESDSRNFQRRLMCNSCYENNVYYCDDCDSYHWTHDYHDCSEGEDEESTDLINSYSYKPRPYFFGKASYHMGFELEVESDGNSRRDGAEVVVNALGERIYLKEDGSLNDGFEIVTHPHSLEEYQANFDWDALNSLRRLGFRSWNTRTCGLHVHVSRTAFGIPNTRSEIIKVQAHELRFMKLIYDNDRQISRLAGRTSQSYASFQDKGHLVNKVKYGSQENGRFSAINSENSATLEVRVFRGSLKPERVLMALELVQCSVEYTRGLHVSASNKALSWMMFARYVAENTTRYPNLFDAMEKSFGSDSINEN